MKSQRGIVWPYLLLGIALLGSLSFGWYQTRQRNQLALGAENNYMSAFHKLKWTSENMEERTAKLMATNDPKQQQGLLADIRVYSAQAVEHMASLPFTTLHTPQIENFLNTVQSSSEEYHHKLNEGGVLSADDWRQLASLRQQTVVFEKELGSMLGLIGNRNIRWSTTVKATSPARTGSAAGPINSSVMQMEKALTPPGGQQQALRPDVGPLAPPRMDPGQPVDAAKAAAAVRAFVDTPLQAEPTLTGTSGPQGNQFPLYFFAAKKANGTALDFGVSVRGGHVIYMIDGRPVADKRVPRMQLIKSAQQVLTKRGYPATQFISAAENDGTLTIDLAPIEKGVAMETDTIKVMLAMDNGELVGFDARNYWINRHPRSLVKPKLTAADALRSISPRLKVEGVPRLAVIADRQHQERLVWEVRGRLDHEWFQVFVDALNGREVDLNR
ncbi:MAG: PepSY1/2 domain-containing protein, partial [Mycobacterium leprae]